MNWKLLLLFPCLLLASIASAQLITPLSGYDYLAASGKEQHAEGAEKVSCTFDLSAYTLITAGDSSNINIGVDTSGFSAGSGYTCQNCNNLEFGTLRSTELGFVYTAFDEVEQGLDT
ncbi:MAG: hypothetical protein AAFU03_00750, partial [Bacteroidota bacterium]